MMADIILKELQQKVARKRELEFVNDSIRMKAEECLALESAEEEFSRLLLVKRTQIEKTNCPVVGEIRKLDMEISNLSDCRNTILQTYEMGERILDKVPVIQATLANAQEAATNRSGGGFAKYNYLNTAQEHAARLQKDVQAFGEGLKTVLADGEMEVDLRVFFQFGNGVANDWMQSSVAMDVVVIERIRTAQYSMRQLDEQVKSGMQSLKEWERINVREGNELKDRLERLIVETVVGDCA